ncbi:hypothetical protein B7494_g3701 [Chlorociboria aeruginascens]|nr:hypothetical protein B7494_g3701 [Chlorociboria aeruginascens]
MSSTQASRAHANGLLPINVSQTASNSSKPVPAVKPPAPKLKVVIRRLAPGLTEAEFTTILGEEWKLGQGKVDWLSYKPGKDSTDPSKLSRPSRAYLKLTSTDCVLKLSEAVKHSTFEDAQNTFSSASLLGPPYVEYALFTKTPRLTRHIDPRSGTIDQDSEFMSFLERLANPNTTKEVNTESDEDVLAKNEKVVTPLVQFLKDKKTSKSKDAAVKAAKKQEIQVAKGKSKEGLNLEGSKIKNKENKQDRFVEKAAKDAVKILNRHAVPKIATATAANPTPSSPSQAQETGKDGDKPPAPGLSKVPGRQRGAAHVRLLKDLGLNKAQTHRHIRRDAANAQKLAIGEKPAESSDSSSQPQTPVTPTAPKGAPTHPSSRRPRGRGIASELNTSKASASPNTPVSAGSSTPITLLKKPETPQSPAAPPTETIKSTPSSHPRKQAIEVPSEGATKAFVKHANPSQGVTEALLKEAMEKFGATSMVEIDKKKGFAYVDFIEPEGLKKAMAANPVSVAQGTVQVMQRKDRPTGPFGPPAKPARLSPAPRGARGGGSVGRGRGRGGRGGPPNGDSKPAIPTGPSAK